MPKLATSTFACLSLVLLGGASVFAQERSPHDEAARLRAKVRILEGRVAALEGVIEDQAVEMAEMRRILTKVTHHLGAERQGAAKKHAKKAKTKHAKKHAKKAKKHAKKAKKKHAKKAKPTKQAAATPEAGASGRGLRAPRIPPLAIAPVEKLDGIRTKLFLTRKRLIELQAAGDPEVKAARQKVKAFQLQAWTMGRALREQSVGALHAHQAEVRKEIEAARARLERELMQVEQSHGELMDPRAPGAGSQERERMAAKLRLQGERLEREVRDLGRQEEILRKQVEEGIAAIEGAWAELTIESERLLETLKGK